MQSECRGANSATSRSSVGSLSSQQLALGMSLAVHIAGVGALIANAGTGMFASGSQRARVMAVQLVVEKERSESPLPSGDKKHEVAGVNERTPSVVAASVPVASASASAIPIPAHTEAHYFPVRDLSLRPSVIRDVSPAIRFVGVPAQTVILRLFINEEGSIDRVDTEQSFLPEAMEESLREAFAAVKFQPGIREGAPVKSQMRIEVRLEDDPERIGSD